MKEKTLYHITLSEVKNHLRIDSGYTTDDTYLSTLINVSHQIAENYIGMDIAKTKNTIIKYDYSGNIFEIGEGNFLSISGITDSDYISYTSKVQTIYNSSFIVELDLNVSNSDLTVIFETGYDTNKIPLPIKQALLIKIADLYDTDRTSYIVNSFKDTGIFEKLLDSYKSISYKYIKN